MSPRGRFITLEGGEGAGKSTQARRLKDALEARGYPVALTREPGGSPGAEEIRALVVQGAPERWTPLAETLLFLAARADHVARLIEPALASGTWVICDRFADSTLVYQGVARRLGMETVRRMIAAVPNALLPDLTLMLDLPVEEGLRRAGTRGELHETRFEKFDDAFHAALRDAFLVIARDEPRRCTIINAARIADDVAGDIWRAVEERLAP